MMFLSNSRTVYIVLLIFGIFFIILGLRDNSVNPFNQPHYDEYYPDMHSIIFNVTDVDITFYEKQLVKELNSTEDTLAKADMSLVLARLLNKKKYYEEACKYYFSYTTNNSEQSAIVYETMASIDCFGQRYRWLKKAKDNWNEINLEWRSNIISNIISGNSTFDFETSVPVSSLDLSNASEIEIGHTSLEIESGTKIISQEDRVFRDWLSLQISGNPFNSTLLKVFSERFNYDDEELRQDIGWHEGGEILDMASKVKIDHSTAVGTMAVKNPDNGKWFAPDEGGKFRFEVLPDKIYYPTTRFLTEDIAMIIDTHGISALVEQSVRKSAKIVIGCCDSVGKIKAALHLSGKNISVICLTDRFSYLALGANSKIIGSARLSVDKANQEAALMSGSIIKIKRNDIIVVSNIYPEKEYPMFYYATPFYYFSEINKTFPLTIIDVKVSEYSDTAKVMEAARKTDAHIVGFRVFNSDDYKEAKRWLTESKENKMILFHSMSYPFGKLLADEFSNQISYGDLNPVVVS